MPAPRLCGPLGGTVAGVSSRLAASSKTNALGRSGRQTRCMGLCQGQELQGAQVEQEWKEIAKTFIFSRGSDSDQGGCWLSPSVADYRQPAMFS